MARAEAKRIRNLQANLVKELRSFQMIRTRYGLYYFSRIPVGVASFLFGMKPNDPLALMLAVATLAKASRIDPTTALRHE
jgi:hypothetical protein